MIHQVRYPRVDDPLEEKKHDLVDTYKTSFRSESQWFFDFLIQSQGRVQTLSMNNYYYVIHFKYFCQ